MRSAGSLSGFSGHWKMANPANVRPDSASLRAMERSSAADGSAGSCLYASAMTLNRVRRTVLVICGKADP